MARRVELSLHPRAVRFEALFMPRRVILVTVLPQPPQDLEPAFAQAAQRAGMVVALLPFALVIRLRPRALLAAAVGPQMDGVPQHRVARPADAGFVQLPALEADRADAIKSVAPTLAQTNVANALTWAQGLPDANSRHLALHEVVNRWADNQPEDAARWVPVIQRTGMQPD